MTTLKMLKPIITCLLAAIMLAGAGCEFDAGFDGTSSVTQVCPEGAPGVSPFHGVAVLEARTLNDDYEAATISFKYATVVEDGQVNNNWDLLFGNDRDPDIDEFSVNMVVDDESFIVDLGPVTICDVPSTVDPADYPVGYYGEHDYVGVEKGHLYVVRNVDGLTRQYAAVRVLEHDLNRSVTILWYRSSDPESFVPPSTCD